MPKDLAKVMAHSPLIILSLLEIGVSFLIYFCLPECRKINVFLVTSVSFWIYLTIEKQNQIVAFEVSSEQKGLCPSALSKKHPVLSMFLDSGLFQNGL